MSEFNSIDDFLGHSGSSGRGGRYLKNWTKKGSINIWLHTRRLPLASWRHQFPQLVVFEDKDTRESVKAYWGKPLNCWEDESFLKSQYKRDENGQLEVTPHKCSMCRLVDVVDVAIRNGELDWCDEIFRFEGASDAKNNQIIRAGGLTGLFGSDKLSEKQKKHLKDNGIYQSEVWKENGHAKLQYIFCVVDNDDVKSGVQIAAQTSLVGDKVKAVINDARASLGDEDGNPMTNPFCIQLTYDEKAPINKRYHARRIERIRMTDEVERLIRDEPPNLAGSVRAFNQKTLRAFLERHATVDLPWDRIFDVPVLELGGDDDFGAEQTDKPEPTTTKAPSAARPVPPPPPSSTRAVAMIPCDGCKKPMPEDATKCGSCGAVYSFDDEEEEPKKAAVRGKTTGDKIPFDKF